MLLPIFFLVTGLSIDLSKLKGRAALDLLYIVIVACTGKFFASAAVAKAARMPSRHAVAIGVMMNTRGLTEIVVLNIARSAGVLDVPLFTALVMMAVITTALTGPALSLIFPPSRLVLEKQLDMASHAAAHGKSLDAGVARICVLVHNVGNHDKLLEAALATLTNPKLRAHLDVLQARGSGAGSLILILTLES